MDCFETDLHKRLARHGHQFGVAAAGLLVALGLQAAGVNYRVSSQWDRGLNAEVTLVNDAAAPLNNWRVSFDYPYPITNLWNGTLVSRTGNRYVVEAPSWRRNLAGNSSTSFGFTASTSGSAAALPANCLINNAAPTTGSCAAGTPGNQAPVAKANGPYSAKVGAAVAFSAAGSADADGSIASYNWNFGDGSASNGANVSHAYAAAGSYTAKLTVTDNRGASGTANAAVTITSGTPPSGGTPVAKNGQLKVCGNQLCNEAGKAIQLRGMSGHGLQWFPQCYANEALDALAGDWGADVFRIALYVQEGGYETDPAGFRAKVDALVEQVSARGMYVIIDWHILNPGDPNKNLTAAKAFFEYMAGKHAARKNVLYEIANEPNGVAWSAIKSYAEQVIPVIRAKAPNAVVLVGTRGWSSLGVSEGAGPEEIVSNPVAGGNLMYAFHFYAKSHQQPYRDALARVVSKLPLFVTEFGTQEFTGDGPNDFVSSQTYLDFFATHRISWVNWNFADDFRSGAVLKQNACANKTFTGSALKDSGSWIRERLLNPPDAF